MGPARMIVESLTPRPGIREHNRKLVIRVEGADAETIMEAGLVMPRPGEEAAWMAANKAALGELAQTAA